MKSYLFRTKEEALDASKELGCEGFHKHKRKTFMPCKSHDTFKNKVKDLEEPKGELDELIDFDGTMNNSKVPLIDPRTSAPGLSTMDKRVASGHQTQDPLMRGYRVYYGESFVREEDMSKAFGHEDTESMNAEETINHFIKAYEFNPEDAKDRAAEMGKDEKIPVNKEIEKEEGEDFIDTMRLIEKEFTKEDIIKMVEDSLVLKSDDKGLNKKDLSDDSVSPILKRNLKALKNMAETEGISIPQLVKMLKNE